VCVTAWWWGWKENIGHKKDVREIHLVISNVGLICEINEIREKR
jgi:hypothetical protein